MSGLVIYESSQAVDAIERLGTMIAKGGLYGCKNIEQGQTLVLMAMAEGLPITEMRKRYHVMNTKFGSTLAMRADYMLAEFRRLGGEYTWIDQGDDGQQAKLRVKYLTNDIEVTFTLDDAKRQKLVKADGNWEKTPDAMLRSRCVTKAVRMVCPEVLAGFQTEDEAGEVPATTSVAAPSTGVVQPQDKDKPGKAAPLAAGSAVSINDMDADAIDAEFSVMDETEKPQLASGSQIRRLTELFGLLKVPPDGQLRGITSTGAVDMSDLSSDGANALIAKMEARLLEIEQQAGPATDGQIERLKTLIEQYSQEVGMGDVPAKIKQHLNSNKIAKLTELTWYSANLLIEGLDKHANVPLDAWFDKPPQRAEVQTSQQSLGESREAAA